MIRPGLVSVTFRQLSPAQIVDLVQRANLEGIEWGGDIHVPHGDLHQARQVRALTKNAGLRVAAYGSYYRVWPQEPSPFEQVVATAEALGAPVIRVWAGKLGSTQADAGHWQHIVRESHQIAELAGQAGIAVAFEYHPNTLTDTQESTLRLLREAAHPNLFTYWQPPVNLPVTLRTAGLKSILPWLWNLHVFAWKTQGQEKATRLPLADAGEEWGQYIKQAAASERDHYALLEFVKDDEPENFLKDADVLRTLTG